MQTSTKIAVAIVSVLVAGVLVLAALLIASKVKCGDASKLFSGCLAAVDSGKTGSYASQTGVRYSFPLSWSGDAYFVDLRLGANTLRCIADTGSDALVVSGRGCQGCPRGATFSAKQDASKPSTTIEYGSQTAVTQQHNARIQGIGGASSAIKVVVDVMYKVSGSSVSNVCGLGRLAGGKPGAQGAPPLLHQLVAGENLDDCVTFGLGNTNELVLGQFTLPSNAVSLPLSAASATMPWFTVARSALGSACNLPASIETLIFDTGTTETLVVSSSAAAVKALNQVTLAPGVSWPMAQYGKYVQPLQLAPGSLPAGTMLIGINWLRQFGVVQFNSDTSKLSFAQ